MRFLVIILVVIIMSHSSQADSNIQTLNEPVWALCKADLGKGYPDRAYLAKPILVKVVAINIKDELLLVTSDQLLLRLGAKNNLNTKSFSECNPLIKAGE